MEKSLARSWRRRTFIAVTAVSASTMLVVGCTNPGGGIPRATTTTTMGNGCMPGMVMPGCPDGGMDHGDGGMDHSQPGQINHPPTAEQKAWAYSLIRRTSAKIRNMTPALATAQGYQNIGDFVHYTKDSFRHDGREYDPDAIESLVFQGGVISAAMYNLEPTTTMANVKDYAGNWLVYHNHDNLCWPRNQPTNWRITPCGIGEKRTPVLMAHVWIRDTNYAIQCGAFATITGLGAGSCIPELRPSVILAGRNPL